MKNCFLAIISFVSNRLWCVIKVNGGHKGYKNEDTLVLIEVDSGM